MSKFYVVWKGRNPGIYETWDDCKTQTVGFKGSSFKSYLTKEEAKSAYASGSLKSANAKSANAKSTNAKNANETGALPVKKSNPKVPKPHSDPIFVKNTISVDAACSGNPGPMEYRGVLTDNPNEEIFHFGPMEGTNNIGEFLAIVEGLKYLSSNGSDIPLYTDSITAMKWVRDKKAATTLKNTDKTAATFRLINEAEHWLHANAYETKIIKWDTKGWGEIKADFGRK